MEEAMNFPWSCWLCQ